MLTRDMFLFLGLFLVLLQTGALQAKADTITVGGTTYTDVYVSQGSNLYYVSNPSDGTVLNVPLAEASGVEISKDQGERTALFREWQRKNRERRGLPEATSTEETESGAEATAEPITPAGAPAGAPAGGGLKPIGKYEPEYARPAPSAPSASTSNPMVYQQRMFEMQRNAQIAQLRQQREAQKLQKLRNVRVITSQDVAGAGGRMGGMGSAGGMGGMGSAGGMGGMGGYGGMGGMGGRGRR